MSAALEQNDPMCLPLGILRRSASSPGQISCEPAQRDFAGGDSTLERTEFLYFELWLCLEQSGLRPSVACFILAATYPKNSSWLDDEFRSSNYHKICLFFGSKVE
jgi:hypothetical protein